MVAGNIAGLPPFCCNSNSISNNDNNNNREALVPIVASYLNAQMKLKSVSWFWKT